MSRATVIERLKVRPGIAGLAQVRGSYWTDPSYKLKYDNLYIETMSPWLDIKLLFLAVWVAIKRVLSGSEISVIEVGDEKDQTQIPPTHASGSEKP